MLKRKEKISFNKLYELCNERNWFNCGSNESYIKFYDIALEFEKASSEYEKISILERLAFTVNLNTSNRVLQGASIEDIVNAIVFNAMLIYFEDEEC